MDGGQEPALDGGVCSPCRSCHCTKSVFRESELTGKGLPFRLSSEPGNENPVRGRPPSKRKVREMPSQ